MTACKPHDWQIARENPPGTFRVFACGYWRDPLVVVVLGRVLIGRRALRRRWLVSRVSAYTGTRT